MGTCIPGTPLNLTMDWKGVYPSLSLISFISIQFLGIIGQNSMLGSPSLELVHPSENTESTLHLNHERLQTLLYSFISSNGSYFSFNRKIFHIFTSVCQEFCPKGRGGVHPPRQTPPGRHPLGRHPPR